VPKSLIYKKKEKQKRKTKKKNKKEKQKRKTKKKNKKEKQKRKAKNNILTKVNNHMYIINCLKKRKNFKTIYLDPSNNSCGIGTPRAPVS